MGENLSRLYIPTTSPEDWKWLLAEPDKQWRPGYSAWAVAHSWEAAGGLPPEIARLIRETPFFAGVVPELLCGFPEHKVDLPGGRRPSQNDVFALLRVGDYTVSLAVEGKVEESFGPLISEWLKDASDGKKRRLKELCEQLGLNPDRLPPTLRYQLLHRTASAIIEADRFKTDAAAMVVQSFSETATSKDDYLCIVDLLRGQAQDTGLTQIKLPSGLPLFVGWADGDRAFLYDASLSARGQEAPTIASLNDDALQGSRDARDMALIPKDGAQPPNMTEQLTRSSQDRLAGGAQRAVSEGAAPPGDLSHLNLIELLAVARTSEQSCINADQIKAAFTRQVSPVRIKPYFVTHEARGLDEPQTNQGEEYLAKQLVAQRILDVSDGGQITLLDYQFPLKAVLSDKIGKVDLIGRTRDNSVALMELKTDDSTENPRVGLLEILTYWAAIRQSLDRINEEALSKHLCSSPLSKPAHLYILAPDAYWVRWREPGRRQRWYQFCSLVQELQYRLDAVIGCLALRDGPSTGTPFTVAPVYAGLEGFTDDGAGHISDKAYWRAERGEDL
jgi:hypothetical protein